MGRRRAATLSASTFRSACIESEPVRPVAAQLEEVVEVDEAAVLESVDQVREHVIGRKGAQSDQSVLDAKLLVGQIESLVDYRASSPFRSKAL